MDMPQDLELKVQYIRLEGEDEVLHKSNDG